MRRIAHDGVLVVGAGLAGFSAALAAAPREVLLLTDAPVNHGCSSAWAQGGMAVALSDDDSAEAHAADTIAAGAGLVNPSRAGILTEEGPRRCVRWPRWARPSTARRTAAFAQSLEAAHSKPRVARVKGDQAGAAIMQGGGRRGPGLGPRRGCGPGTGLRGLLQDATAGFGASSPSITARLVEITARHHPGRPAGVGGLYAVTTTPAELQGEGLGLAALAERSSPIRSSYSSTPRPSTSAATPRRWPPRRCGAKARCWSTPTANASWPATIRPPSSRRATSSPAPSIRSGRPAAAPSSTPREAGRGALLRRIPRGVRRLHVRRHRPAQPADPGGPALPLPHGRHRHRRGRTHQPRGPLRRRRYAPPPACMARTAWRPTPCWRRAVFGARAGRAAAREAAPSPARLVRLTAPELPDQALQTLRRAMSRYAGVVRSDEGLRDLLDLIDDLEARHGRAAPLAAARLVAASALTRTENRGGHFPLRRRAPGGPAAPDLRDLVRPHRRPRLEATPPMTEPLPDC